MNNYTYAVATKAGTFMISSPWPPARARYVAEEAAEQYYREHDGWDDEWPITISIFEAGSDEPVGRFEIDIEMVPSFFSTEVEELPANGERM